MKTLDPGLRRDDKPGANGWSFGTLLAAPHRLAFFLAMVVLVASGLWWTLIQLDRVAGIGLSYELAPSVVHAAVMTFGFMPLFFAGFLFTAGPKWLGVAPPTARDVRNPLLLYAAGWMTWPALSHLNAHAAAASLLAAWIGLAWITARFVGLVRASPAPDRVHAKCIAAALVAGCLCMAGAIAGVLLDDPGLARSFVMTALWAFVVVVYASVAHRMIPFFTSSALPMVQAWRPFWVLRMLVGVALFEAACVWIDASSESGAWHAIRGAIELAAGGIVIWLAFAWGLVQSLKVRLVAMLHIGFSWLGIGLALSGVSQLVLAATGDDFLPLAALHAVTMGCLGSLMVAMVTRVTCGHGGRALVADNLVWVLFWLLQLAVLLRIAAAAPLDHALQFTLAAAAAWAAVLTAWALRYGGWYGRPRADGRPG